MTNGQSIQGRVADRLINSAHLWDATWNPTRLENTVTTKTSMEVLSTENMPKRPWFRSGTVRLVPKHAARTSSRCRRMARQRRSNAQMRAV